MASLLPYVTSDWQLHSLLNVVGIVSSSMTAAVYIPMAKVLDVWGRAEGFLLMISFSVIGLAIAAGSQNLPTFCAAQVRVDDILPYWQAANEADRCSTRSAIQASPMSSACSRQM